MTFSQMPYLPHPNERCSSYKLKVSAVHVEPNAEDLSVSRRLTFFGNCAEALTGKEAELLAPLTKGCPNYVPPAVIAAVGKKCTITAEVDQETYDADPGIVFLTISKAQLITDSVTSQKAAPYRQPPKDILEPINADEEEDMGKGNKDKKRKSTDFKKGPARKLCLFRLPSQDRTRTSTPSRRETNKRSTHLHMKFLTSLSPLPLKFMLSNSIPDQ